MWAESFVHPSAHGCTPGVDTALSEPFVYLSEELAVDKRTPVIFVLRFNGLEGMCVSYLRPVEERTLTSA